MAELAAPVMAEPMAEVRAPWAATEAMKPEAMTAVTFMMMLLGEIGS